MLLQKNNAIMKNWINHSYNNINWQGKPLNVIAG